MKTFIFYMDTIEKNSVELQLPEVQLHESLTVRTDFERKEKSETVGCVCNEPSKIN